MFSKSSWLHLRIPFSYFLLPVYLFALGISPNYYNGTNGLLWTFIIVHLFLYPASNGFNSYFDKDEKSIGGLKNPPPVTAGLYYLALIFDVIAVVLGWYKIGVSFAGMLVIYGLASKAYSHPSIRLKKYPVTGWVVTGFFQGFFTFLMCYMGINNYPLESLFRQEILLPAALTSLMLMGNYPMTQVYQHEEDLQRGDKTLSILLGIRGTFIFTQAIFLLAAAGFCYFFITYFNSNFAIHFLVALTPVVAYFMVWFVLVLRNPLKADYRHTMFLNAISSTCLNLFFIHFFLENGHLVEYFRS